MGLEPECRFNPGKYSGKRCWGYLAGIVLLIGLGSLFGGILEVSGGAQCVAQTLINKFGEKKSGIALGITGLVVGTTVFFEAGVVIQN